MADATGKRRKVVPVGGAARQGAGQGIGDRMKLHRHLVRLDGRQYTVITPRPGTGPRFSTNYTRRVSAARTARRDILAGPAGRLSPADQQPLIWQRGAAILSR